MGYGGGQIPVYRPIILFGVKRKQISFDNNQCASRSVVPSIYTTHSSRCVVQTPVGQFGAWYYIVCLQVIVHTICLLRPPSVVTNHGFEQLGLCIYSVLHDFDQNYLLWLKRKMWKWQSISQPSHVYRAYVDYVADSVSTVALPKFGASGYWIN